MAEDVIDFRTHKNNFYATIMLQIYQSSIAHGPSAIQTAGGLYHMGTVFLKEGKPVVALSFMEQVSEFGMNTVCIIM